MNSTAANRTFNNSIVHASSSPVKRRASAAYTACTVSTSDTMSTVVSYATPRRPLKSPLKGKRREAQFRSPHPSHDTDLIRQIAKDMVSTLVNEYASGDENSSFASSKDCSFSASGEGIEGSPGSVCSSASGNNGNDGTQLDIRAITKVVMASVEEQLSSSRSSIKANPDRALREMLREGLVHADACSDDSHFEEQEDCDNENTKRATTASATTSRSGSSFPSASSGGAPVDIWHPDFWNTGADEDAETETAGASSSGCGSDLPTRTLSSSGRSGESSCGKTLHDFLKERNNEMTISSSSDSDEDAEELSVLSDISGLTGVFDDYPPERRIVKGSDEKKMGGSMDASHWSANTRPSCDGSLLVRSVAHSAATATTLSTTKKKKKRVVSFTVNFTEVHVRQYERILCDNPASAGGPSIGIGWEYVADAPISVDKWEVDRPRRVRGPDQLVLSREKREKMIRGLGYSEKEIASTVRILNRARHQRKQTVNNLGSQKMEEAVESAARQVKKMLFLNVVGSSSSMPMNTKELDIINSIANHQPERFEM